MASAAAVNVLKNGGNAIDAAAVMQWVLGMTEPMGSGIGGGCFIMIYKASTNEIIAIDGREEIWSNYTQVPFYNNSVFDFPTFLTGANNVGIPGTLAAISRALSEYGSGNYNLSQTFEPAIALAESGYVIDPFYAYRLQGESGRLANFNYTTSIYFNASGKPRQVGDTVKNPDLANAMRGIQQNGIQYLYGGLLGQKLIDTLLNSTFVNSVVGVRDLNDLANYKAVKRYPLNTTYRGYEIFGMNMPTSGGANLILMLNMLEQINTSSWTFGSFEHVKTITDIMNIAFSDRNFYMADSDFQNVPINTLVSKQYAIERLALFPGLTTRLVAPVAPGVINGSKKRDISTPTYDSEGEDEQNPKKSTTHFSIVDSQRNVVSITSSLEQFFGSCESIDESGILLNNQLTDFEILNPNATAPNDPETRRATRRTALPPDDTTMGGKRPRSSMSPTIIKKDGKPYLAIGAPGGSRIALAVFNILVNHIDLGMDLHSAINKSRIFARNSNTVEIESPLYENTSLRTQMTTLGYTVSLRSINTAIFAVAINEPYVEGVSDFRYPLLTGNYGNEPFGY